MGKGLSRRELLKKAGFGGAVFLDAAVGDYTNPGTVGHSVIHEGGAPSLYHQIHAPPDGLGPGDLDLHTFPPPPDDLPAGSERDVEISVEERLIEVGSGAYVEAWTYNGTVPGPIIRAKEGDVIRVHLVNRTGNPHNVHFHGSHRPEHDGWEPVPPFGETTYEIDAGPAGLHPYHCHTVPLSEHISRGLYGMMIVDPPGGRPPATEVALLLSGFSTEQTGRNGIVAWNGVAGFYHNYPIKVTANGRIRVYLVNMLEHEPIASFHLHAETFDVYPAGMREKPASREDTVALAMGQRAIVEFTLPTVGRYMFHPHQHWLAERGAMGWFAAV